MKNIVTLFFDFFQFGCFTFGGGWSIVAQMQKLYVEKRKTIEDTDLLDMASVGRSLPGTMIGNIAMLFGHRIAGVAGGLACMFGMILPPFVVLTVITYFYTLVKENIWVVAAMNGIRCAIVPIIGVAAYKMIKGAFKYPPCFLVALLTFFLYLFLDMNCVYLVLIGGVSGLLICAYYNRKSMSADASGTGEERSDTEAKEE